VHDAAHGRIRLGRHLDEVKVEALGEPQRLGDGLDAQLIAVRADQPDLARADTVVDPVLFALSRCYDRSLLCNGFLPWVVANRRTLLLAAVLAGGFRSRRRPDGARREAGWAVAQSALAERPDPTGRADGPDR